MKLAAAALLFLAALTQPAGAQQLAGPAATAPGLDVPAQIAIRDAEEAATSWLAIADAANYADSWAQGAAALRGAVTQAQWNEALRGVRAPLGAVKSRKLVSARYTRALPGAPEGEYVVIQYETEFAARNGIETVTPMREADGKWKVSGYFIK